MKPESILIMLSGGVESSALLQLAVNNDYIVECVHATWDNKTAMEHKQAKEICKIFEVPYSNIILNAEEFNSKERTLKPIKDSPRWAAALLLTAPVGDYDEIWFGSFLGETTPGATGPAGAEILLRSAGCNAKVTSPLYQMKKIDQWKMLRPDVRSLITSCNEIKSDGDLPCGECEKCQEWKLHNIVKDA